MYLTRIALKELQEGEIDSAIETINLGLDAADQLMRKDASTSDPKASGRLYLPCLVGFTILGWSRMALIIREGTLPAIAIISMFGLAVGHLWVAPMRDDRTLLAFATVSRQRLAAIGKYSTTLLQVRLNSVTSLRFMSCSSAKTR